MSSCRVSDLTKQGAGKAVHAVLLRFVRGPASPATHSLARLHPSPSTGRYDMVCPMKSAWDLHKKWPKAELKVVADAGHSCVEAGIIHELVEACDKFKNV